MAEAMGRLHPCNHCLGEVDMLPNNINNLEGAIVGNNPPSLGNTRGHRIRAWRRNCKLQRGIKVESFYSRFSGQNTGINFDKYEEIPVEATGFKRKINEKNFAFAGVNCPQPIQSVISLVEEHFSIQYFDSSPTQTSTCTPGWRRTFANVAMTGQRPCRFPTKFE
jgi:hypothetical protein